MTQATIQIVRKWPENHDKSVIIMVKPEYWSFYSHFPITLFFHKNAPDGIKKDTQNAISVKREITLCDKMNLDHIKLLDIWC